MLEELDYPKNPQMANDFRILLNKFNLKEINEEEFNIQLCEITCKHQDCIDDFKYKKIPERPPDVSKWRFLKENEKADLLKKDSEYYKNNIMIYYENINKIKINNDRNKDQLVFWIRLNINNTLKKIIGDVLLTHGRTGDKNG